MNNPKIFLTTLMLLTGILLSLLSLDRHQDTTEVQANVVSQTLTQSLDGNRRFLNIQFTDGHQTLISIPPQIECPAGSIVILLKESSIFSGDITYRYMQCETYTNKH